jgi:hypothetical protein
MRATHYVAESTHHTRRHHACTMRAPCVHHACIMHICADSLRGFCFKQGLQAVTTTSHVPVTDWVLPPLCVPANTRLPCSPGEVHSSYEP